MDNPASVEKNDERRIDFRFCRSDHARSPLALTSPFSGLAFGSATDRIENTTVLRRLRFYFKKKTFHVCLCIQ